MSKFAKKPIVVPADAEVAVDGSRVTVKGPLGSLTMELMPCDIRIECAGECVRFSSGSDSRRSRSLLGTYFRNVRNMVIGVTEGFTRELALVGVGYRANAGSDSITLNLGFSNPVVRSFPEGVKAETPSQTEIVVKGIDKQAVGQFAEEIKKLRPTEPYKGKGVRFKGDRVTLKETKKK